MVTNNNSFTLTMTKDGHGQVGLRVVGSGPAHTKLIIGSCRALLCFFQKKKMLPKAHDFVHVLGRVFVLGLGLAQACVLSCWAGQAFVPTTLV